ncbi:Putative glycosyl transferase, family 20, HAD-superfamily hydrolase, subfamily IIB, HAD superfamily [Septoria linicola]|uniref:Glycosyl transferase, family 20, HAD-superfamily hydrolase, subfamily IIB, HAD superfamily n=1 Tax=Septoria linicola TaxID=215465 RepID=A0A9Q9EMX3_9PEZI|nr:putative glycosyl transferase, family 20, HAD-superfamily hydrolase, subfamily IIB, HAD superfamily [Septoria linicola]USW56490.1 Putative glycosyl transferase, family 20, HAD-superfamily hydrolase, subfamily IIB, HAD superfamily [Septoria linicola]
MSGNTRPTAERQDTTLPGHLCEDITSIPVTPTVSNESNVPPNSGPGTSRNPPQHVLEAVGASGQQEYFSDRAGSTNAPSSAHATVSGAKDGEDLLRRLSLTAATSKPDFASIDPSTAHPALGLSGNIISATFAVPYKVGYTTSGEWELNPRRGTSALFNSFSWLASDESPWKHTLVGWTGEIDRVIRRKESDHSTGTNGITSMDSIPLSKQSAPIPVNKGEKPPQPTELSELHVPLADRRKLERKLEAESGGHVSAVWLWDDIDGDEVATFRNQSRWRRYAEHELFTLFHYKQNEPSDGRALRKTWADYYLMNKTFADHIMNIYTPGDIILIHDYHLLLLPSLLRQRLPNVYIGFFLHVPFPSSEYYRCLTRRKEILEGVLGSNMIGFQAYSYARHFSSCCTRVLGFDSSSAGVDAYGAHVPVDVFPIGINAEATIKAAFESARVEGKMQSLREQYHGKQIIVGRDRLDTVRGVAQKLQAFEIFLERHPDMHDKVVLIQVTSPTSIEDRDDKGDKTANKISELVARINGTYGSLSFTPVQHYPQYLSEEEYFALLRIADLGLITSVRDGMNTTALEYVACQRDNHGPLIISEFSGTAGSLADAIHINPWDLGGTADEIHAALLMSEGERQQQHQLLYQHVTQNTVQNWTVSYIKRLLTNLASHDQSFATPVLDRAKLLQQYRDSTRRLFMFDYDGTLTPIVRDPNAAIPSDRVIRSLKTLASDPKNQVWIISGRDQAFLDEWMGHISELGLSAEHGSFMRPPNSSEWENLTETLDMSWQDEVMRVFNHYSERTQGSFIERKKIALTWHYRRADPEYGAFMARECQRHLNQTVAKKWEVEVMTGKANLEVRPRFVNKGEIAKRLVREYGEETHQAPDFVFCAGDDFTDEGKIHLLPHRIPLSTTNLITDMFRTLRRSKLPEAHRFAVTVGAKTKQTLASWHLLEPSDIISCIALLNGAVDAGNVGAVAVVDGVIPDSRPVL